MIQFKNVTKAYDNGIHALQNVNLTVEKGEFLFIVGASGAGKSTLIKLLLKEIEPTQGQVIVDGVDLSHLRRKEVPHYRRKLGVVFQDFRLLEDKTIYENVAFAMEITEVPRAGIQRRVPEVLNMVGLGRKAGDYPGQLSGGEQQRAALARALVNRPAMLIADEPTGNLDPETADEIMRILVTVNQRGTTVLMATHAKDIVNSMEKRVVTFQSGRIVSDKWKGEYFDEIKNME